jgi:hypothetical protein
MHGEGHQSWNMSCSEWPGAQTDMLLAKSFRPEGLELPKGPLQVGSSSCSRTEQFYLFLPGCQAVPPAPGLSLQTFFWRL